MFRAELEDVLANLLRNALAAGADRVGVGLARAEDPVTGQEWIELRVRDDAPGALTNAMIRGRHLSRGLGLVADVTRRHGGSVRVEPAAGEGTKVVVVSLPGVEAASVEVEWTG
jgi:signal transduction histidine kinase